jgi:hypothetical protein
VSTWGETRAFFLTAFLRVKSAAGEVPLAGSFSVGLFPNRACKFPRTLHASLPSL